MIPPFSLSASLFRSAFAFPLALFCLFVCDRLAAQPPDLSPRVSPLVKVVKQVEPAVVSLFIRDSENKSFDTGSGTIIHPDGYVLTNHHVVGRDEGYAVYRGKLIGFVVVGRLPEKDLAIVRLRGVTTPLPVVAIGHSHDVMNGESVAVMGNPGGRGTVVTSGIVSSNRQFLGGMSALAMTQFPGTRRDVFIQFDAASNRGNSGGPLINMEGKLIGVVSALIPAEQNSSFAIPVDRFRRLLERVIEPEMVHRRTVGISLNPLADSALVTGVATDSPASGAGIQSGDIIQAVNGRPIRHSADWTFTLDQRLPKGQPLEIVVKRGEATLPIRVKPAPLPPRAPVAVDDASQGLAYEFYHGKFEVLPDFDQLQPERTGTVEKLDLSELRGDRESEYAIRLTGFVNVEEDGMYRLTITSDDGSRVSLHDQLLIDHDGKHPPMPASRLIRVKAGLHPIRIEFFQGIGGHSLSLKLEKLKSPAHESQDGEFEPRYSHSP